MLKIRIPKKLKWVFSGKARYRGAYGGRGSAKSMSFAVMTLIKGIEKPTRVLCAREIQNTIKDSVHREITDAIDRFELGDYYDYGESYIRGTNGTEYLFKGLRHNKKEIKSTTGIDICWVEEAEAVSEDSWRLLTPTIRADDSEIWLTWNREEEDSATELRFIKEPPPSSRIAELNYQDNPFFPDVLEEERIRDFNLLDKYSYNHIWNGALLTKKGGEIYDDYSEENHTDKVFSKGTIYWAHDFNFMPMSSAIIQRHSGKDYVVDEIILEHAAAKHAANEFVERYQDHKDCKVVLFGDPSGRVGEKHGLLSNYIEMETILRNNGFTVSRRVFASTRSIRDGQNSLRGRILTASGDRHLFVNPDKAPTVDRGLKTVQVKKGSTYQEDESNNSQHIVSAIRYFSSYEYPVYGRGTIEVS